jgi:hypothetical protein
MIFLFAPLPRGEQLRLWDCCGTTSLNSRGEILARSRGMTGGSLVRRNAVTWVKLGSYTRNTLDSGMEKHTNAVLELTLAIIRESPPPNQRELPQVRNEVLDAHPSRRLHPSVMRWTSADRVVTSSVDIGPSTSSSNFKFVTKFHNVTYCSCIRVVRCMFFKEKSIGFINACTDSNSVHHIG